MIKFIIILLAIILKPAYCDYIRSDEIILNDDLDIGSELINLNKLMFIQKQKDSSKNYLFKLVNDSVLINYIELKHLNSETTLILLNKKLSFEEICSSENKRNSCNQSIKIIAVNENDFIEIPIQIQRYTNKNKKKTNKLKLNLNFQQETIYLNVTSLTNIFKLDPAFASFDKNQSKFDSFDRINYKIEDGFYMINKEFFNMSLNGLNLKIEFRNKNMLEKAFNLNKLFNFKVSAFSLNTEQFEIKRNASLNIILRVEENKVKIIKQKNEKKVLKPLDFEEPIYSIVITDLKKVLLQPKLKNSAEIDFDSNEIMFTLHEETSDDFPFKINDANGEITLLRNIWENNDEYEDEKFYSFGIKATYRDMINSTKNSYDYMIPAYAKIQISFRKEDSNHHPKLATQKDLRPIIKSEIITSFITKYEIINEDTINQTYILYINDPIGINTKLIRLYLNNNNQEYSQWVLHDESIFKYQENNKSDVIISNKIEFKDQNTYKTLIQVVEKSSSKRKKVLSELKLEFRIDFDPLLFEQNEYNLYLTQSDLINQDLIKFNIKERLNNNKLDYLKNILFRITSSTANTNDEDYFEINSSNGWMQVKKLLTNKYYYELNVIGLSNELQKTAMAKVKINIDCFKHNKDQLNNNYSNKYKKVKFSIFENSSNRTQIGSLKSVCSNSNYHYDIDQQSVSLKLCSYLKKNCSLFSLNLNKLNNNPSASKLFDLDTNYANLMTNYLINSNLILNLVKNQNELDYILLTNEASIYDSNQLILLVNSSFKNSINTDYKLNYEIEILMQDSPRIINFDDTIILDSQETKQENENDEACIFNYKFPSHQTTSSLHRFVKIDSNSAHIEAEFKTIDCFGSFFIYNNGCLSLKYDHLNKSICSSNKDNLIFKSGTYELEFKLCYYDTNKVSCSQMYNQNIVIRKDLNIMSKIKVSYLINENFMDEIESSSVSSLLSQQKQSSLLSSLLLSPSPPLSRQMNSTKTNYIFFNDTNKSYYLLMLVVVILVIALLVILAFTFLFIIYARPSSLRKKSAPNDSSKLNNQENCLVVTTSPSTDTNKSSSLNTPETSSNAATTSSKISKTDDENEDMVKIQVSDDCSSITNKSIKHVNQQQCQIINGVGYMPSTNHNINTNYSASFSSLSSSSHSSNHQLEDSNVKKSLKVMDTVADDRSSMFWKKNY